MDTSYLIKPILDTTYPVIDYGKGIYLYDKTGKNTLMDHLEQLPLI